MAPQKNSVPKALKIFWRRKIFRRLFFEGRKLFGAPNFSLGATLFGGKNLFGEKHNGQLFEIIQNFLTIIKISWRSSEIIKNHPEIVKSHSKSCRNHHTSPKLHKTKKTGAGNDWEPSNDLFVNFRERSISSRRHELEIVEFFDGVGW